MRFFRIRKNRNGDDQIDYQIFLYSNELKKEFLPIYTSQIGAFTHILGSAIILDYYHYVEDDPLPKYKVNFNHHLEVQTYEDPKDLARDAAILASIPSFRMEYVLGYLLKGGWMQVYHDARAYAWFFEDRMPPCHQAFYNAEIFCKTEDGSDHHSEYFSFFAETVEKARSTVMSRSAEAIDQLRKTPSLAKFVDPFIRSVGEWMQNGMTFYSVQTVTPADFEWTFTSVQAKGLLDRICPKEEQHG